MRTLIATFAALALTLLSRHGWCQTTASSPPQGKPVAATASTADVAAAGGAPAAAAGKESGVAASGDAKTGSGKDAGSPGFSVGGGLGVLVLLHRGNSGIQGAYTDSQQIIHAVNVDNGIRSATALADVTYGSWIRVGAFAALSLDKESIDSVALGLAVEGVVGSTRLLLGAGVYREGSLTRLAPGQRDGEALSPGDTLRTMTGPVDGIVILIGGTLPAFK